MEYRVKVEHDHDPLNPRTEWDNLGKMICFHRDYNLGDEHDYRDAEEAFVDLLDTYGTAEEKRKAFLDLCFRDALSISDVKKLIRDYQGDVDDMIANTLNDDYYSIGVVAQNHIPEAIVALPLFLYDHSGITMSCSPFSCGWDSGQVGLIYVPVSTIEKSCGKNPGNPSQTWEERTVEILEGEVATYDAYLTGQIFCFIVEEGKTYTAEDGDTLIDWNIVDSCGGFFDEDECEQEGESMADYYRNLSSQGESSPTP